MFKFLKSLFGHKFSIEPKFNVGDLCVFPFQADGCEDVIGKITNLHYCYNKKTKRENIKYDFTDTFSNLDYFNVNEDEIYHI